MSGLENTAPPGSAKTPTSGSWVLAAHACVLVAYVTWRAGFTLSGDHPVFASVFFAAELFSIVTSIVFYALVMRRPAEENPPPAPDGLRVDILIATYNESPVLVRTTAVAAREVRYPHRTWICDDGNRPEMRSLAEELGVGYITRPSNEGFKAGNLNHALQHTDGEFVAILDADHVLAPDFLSVLLGHFDDPRVGLVQIPQVYYNIDSYQHVISERQRTLWHESSLFHHRMQPGAHSRGAAFFVGTGAILRRTALEEIGGFATGSVTEDIHTSIRLHAAGHQSVYVDRALGYLLAPDTPLAYACQRLRWAQGAMQVLRREPALWRGGLTGWQRIGYLNSLLGYFASYQHLIFYLAPGIYLLTGVSPIHADPRVALAVFSTYIALSLAVYKHVASPQGRLFLGECYKMINLAVHLRGTISIFSSEGLPFRVTPKGAHRGLPWFLVVPPTLLLLFNLTALGVGLLRVTRVGSDAGTLLLTGGFASFFSIAGALAVLHAFERRGHAERFSFPVWLAASLHGSGSSPGVPALIRRLNHDVAYVEEASTGEEIQAGSIDLSAVGVRRLVAFSTVDRSSRGAHSVLKIELIGLSGAERDLIDRFVFRSALPRFLASYADGGAAQEQPCDAKHETRAGSEEIPFLPVRAAIV